MIAAAAVVTACVTFLGGILLALLSDLISEEVRSRLDSLPRTLVRLIARFLPPTLRERYEGDWIGVLDEHLHGNESRPITRLLKGTHFAFGLWRAAWNVRREYTPEKSPGADHHRWVTAMSLCALFLSGVATLHTWRSELVSAEVMPVYLTSVIVAMTLGASLWAAVLLVLRYWVRRYMRQEDRDEIDLIAFSKRGEVVILVQTKYREEK